MALNFLGLGREAIDTLLPFLGGAAGAFPTNTSGSSETKSAGSTDTQSNLTALSQLIAQLNGTQQQTVSPEIQALIDKSASTAGTQLAGTNLEPFVAQQTEQINRNALLQRQAADNIMASRGLATSPVSATTDANIDAQRVAGITNVQQSLPMLQAELAQRALSGATGVAASAPRGTVTTQRTSQTGQTGQAGTVNTQNQNQQNQNFNTSSGGGAGGAIGGFASLLANLFA